MGADTRFYFILAVGWERWEMFSYLCTVRSWGLARHWCVPFMRKILIILPSAFVLDFCSIEGQFERFLDQHLFLI